MRPRPGTGSGAFLILGQWTTNDDNLYSSSLGITGAMPSWHKPYVVLALGLTATVVAAIGGANLFVPFLLTLGVAIPPLGGVLIADHLWVRPGRRREEAAFSVHAFMAWIAGALAGAVIPFGIAAVNSIVAGLGFYLLLSMSRKRQESASPARGNTAEGEERLDGSVTSAAPLGD